MYVHAYTFIYHVKDRFQFFCPSTFFILCYATHLCYDRSRIKIKILPCYYYQPYDSLARNKGNMQKKTEMMTNQEAFEMH